MTLILAASLLILTVTLGYTALCAVSPFGTCRRCHGFGFATTTDRKGRPKRGKECRRCHGHGLRIRTGRHLHNLWCRTYDRGTTADQPAAPARPFTPNQEGRS
jgi:ribosomal protein L40E